MSATYLGGVSVGQVVPVVPVTLAQLGNLMAPQLAKQGDINTRLAIPFSPPDPTMLLTALEAQISSLAATLATLPALDAQARADLVVELGLVQSLLAPAQALVATLGGVLSTGGLHLYALDNTVGQLGADLGGAVGGGLPGGGGPTGHANALVIVTESPSAWKALGVCVRNS